MSAGTVPLLFESLALRALQVPNRVMVSPMCQYSAQAGCAGDWHLMHLGQFAVSGVGLLCTEMTNVEAIGRITPHCLGLYDEACEAALARVVHFCRQHGEAPMAVQLSHAGRKASVAPPWEGRRALRPEEGAWQPVAPSAVPTASGGTVPHELDAGEISALVQRFVEAAARARRIGFDAIELHAAHGYLLHQFLSPLSNRRRDGYGGALAARLRFVLEVFEAVREAWPRKRPLGVRISATDWADGGWDLAQSTVLCRELRTLGCDWIDVSSGGLIKNQVLPTGPGYQVPLAAHIRAHCDIPVIAVGMITGAQQAEAILRDGHADMVALARALLYDPRWVWHAAEQLGAQATYPPQYLRARPWVRNDIFAEREAAR